MLHFRATIYALPPVVATGPQRKLRNLALPTIAGESNGPPLFTESLPVTFDSMQAQLLENTRCDCEPDGFFLLTGHAGKTFWRVNGHMHEHEGTMHRVELHGECPTESLDILLRSMGWPQTQLAFELVKEGVTLSEKDFRKYATASESRVVVSKIRRGGTAARVKFPPPPPPTAPHSHRMAHHLRHLRHPPPRRPTPHRRSR